MPKKIDRRLEREVAILNRCAEDMDISDNIVSRYAAENDMHWDDVLSSLAPSHLELALSLHDLPENGTPRHDAEKLPVEEYTATTLKRSERRKSGEKLSTRRHPSRPRVNDGNILYSAYSVPASEMVLVRLMLDASVGGYLHSWLAPHGDLT